MSTLVRAKRLAFDLETDLDMAGFTLHLLDMDAVAALYAEECKRQGYEFIESSRHDSLFYECREDWNDTSECCEMDERTIAWQKIHDAISWDAILNCSNLR